MGRADQLHASLRNRSRRRRFGFRADFVDDDDFGHVILDGFDHHVVLQGCVGNLHAARVADAAVRDIAIPADLVGRVDDDDALTILGEHAGALA